MKMDEPRYPLRGFVVAGECGRQPILDLEEWVRGGTFHRYGVKATERAETVEESLQLMRKHRSRLHYEGVLNWHRGMDWKVTFQQSGDPDSWGMTTPHMTAEDAAYHALTMIEEHEREVWEQNLVVGTA